MVPMAVIRTQQHFRLCVVWEQKSRMIAAGGRDCKVILLWDANRELIRLATAPPSGNLGM